MITATPLTILALLLALHRPPMAYQPCIEAHRAAIVAAGAEAETIGVPASVLFAVARRESHLGCAGETDWGAPGPRRESAAQRRNHRNGVTPSIRSEWRHIAGTPMDAARALRRSFEACGNWRAAVGRFRSGLCNPWQPAHRSYVASVMRDVAAIDSRPLTATGARP